MNVNECKAINVKIMHKKYALRATIHFATFVQLFSATVRVKQLNAALSGWWLLIGL